MRNKWRFHLKDGIMSLNGKDYVFQKATGDGEWWFSWSIMIKNSPISIGQTDSGQISLLDTPSNFTIIFQSFENNCKNNAWCSFKHENEFFNWFNLVIGNLFKLNLNRIFTPVFLHRSWKALCSNKSSLYKKTERKFRRSILVGDKYKNNLLTKSRSPSGFFEHPEN